MVPSQHPPKINSFFLSSNLANLVESSAILPCVFSDHDYVNLVLNTVNFIPRGPGVWKFNNSLLSDTSFVEFITARIVDLSRCISRFPSVKTWWEFFKLSIKKESTAFAKEKRKQASAERNDLTDRLIVCRQLLVQGDTSVASEITSLEAQLHALFLAELEGAKVRSRVQWIEEGERPTRYFLKMEQERAAKNHISSIFNKAGLEVSSREDLEAAHVDFYQELFTATDIDLDCQHSLLQSMPSRLSDSERVSCEGAVSLPELIASVNSLSAGKTPGPDGLTLEFFVYFWSLLGPLLVRVYNECLRDAGLPDSMKTSVTRLIYKKKGDIKDLKNWRPISLLNVDYKIVSKAITLRLSKVLHSIIDPDQTCSVPGRSISANVTLLRDLLDYIDLTGETGVLVSLDQEKAFDWVNRTFLANLLTHLGFGPDFLWWFHTFYSGANMRILLNGWLTKPIALLRGVRQGDPLSLLLYVLCVEVLAVQIRISPHIRGFLLPGARGLHFKVRQYADDTTSFLKDFLSLTNLFNVISVYERGTGAKLNRSKTEAMWLGAWKSRTDEPLGLTWVKKMKILGVVFGTIPVEQDNWQPKINKLEKSINLWKSRSLSFVGKSVIINVLGLSKLFYLAKVLVLPAWVPRRVNQIVWPFLWGSKIETVSRNSCSVSPLDGGLGVINFPLKCAALRVSSMIATVNSPDDKSFFLCKYFIGSRLAVLSPDWLTLRDNSSPSALTPSRFYEACVTTLVSVDYRQIPLTTKAVYRALNKVKSSPPILPRQWSHFLWPGFSLKEHWARVRDGVSDNRANDLFWLITLRGVKVRDSLKNWGYIASDRCGSCNRKETIDHCFLNCVRAKRVWTRFAPTLSAVIGSVFVTSLLSVFFFSLALGSAKKLCIARFLIKSVTLSIWVFRNKSTFHNGCDEAGAIIKFALHSIKGRVRLDFTRLSREQFQARWASPGFCEVRNNSVVFFF